MEKQKIHNLELWREFQEEENNTKKDKLRQKLVEIYYPLVQQISYKMAVNLSWKVSPEELTSFGLDGLYVAIDRFSLVRGVDFPTYANRRISGSMIDGIRREDYIPRSVRIHHNMIERTKSEMEAEEGRRVTEYEVIEKLGIDQEQFLKNTKKYKPVNFISLEGSNIKDPNKQEDFKQDSLIDITDKDIDDPDERLLKNEFLNKLISKNFSRIEQKIIYYYYYINLTMENIANKIGMSESRVSQIHTDILPRLRNKIERNPEFFKEEISKYIGDINE